MVATLEHYYKGAKTRSRRAAYSFAITHFNNCTNPNHSPAKTFDSYTWPDSVAPSTNVTPVRHSHLSTTQAVAP